MVAEGVELVLLLAGAFIGSFVSAVCGFGGGFLILPLIVAVVGPRTAVPLITLGLLFSNTTRLLLLRQFIIWRMVWPYAAGGVIGAIIGGIVFTQLSTGFLFRSIGALLIISVIVRRWKTGDILADHIWVLTPVGVFIGFFSAVWGAVGPFAVPFFLATGIRKERFVATLAVGALCIHLAKATVYGQYDLLHINLVKTGLALGVMMIIGTWVGKQVLTRTTPRLFLILVDTLLVVIGVIFLVR
ncbi:MAG: TSUP family transporter [candidate division Zixibacteria bacterium]|nr:TSUP family transporter [candidate division Zixibacteria bacterium]